MNKITRSLLIIIGMLLIVCGATLAVWNDQAVIGANTFQTGKLSINTAPSSALFTAENIFPGWSETKSLIINNDGTAPVNYSFLTSKSGTSTVLYNSDYFLLKVGTTSGGSELYNGAIKSGSFSAPRNLAIGASDTLYITVSLSTEAGNDLQDKSAAVNFVFDATS